MTNSQSKILPDPKSERRCRCGYVGPVESFPRRKRDLGYKMKCQKCDTKDVKYQDRQSEKRKAAKETSASLTITDTEYGVSNVHEITNQCSSRKLETTRPAWRWDKIPVREMKWEEVLEWVSERTESRDKSFALHAMADLSIMFAVQDDHEVEGDVTEPLDSGNDTLNNPGQIARQIAREIWEFSGHRFM
ncbi:hypothetical protein PQX77_011289 [Marasmius sp. AFHP31]|nr:hypothetical protein PQX77_011289 [Marasmius sp. AFHP31]